jgi:hypothetical protein
LAFPGGEALPPSFLKHADEQTVVGLAAVFQAIHRFGLVGNSFTDWGVLAGPRFLGRACLAVALQRFALEGAWGVSPHLIPHRSLHSISGTVSQALSIHGPNIGVGGGPAGAAETLLAAAALLSDGRLPGVWVVLTGWDPEPVIERGAYGDTPRPAPHTNPINCCAAALALTMLQPEWDAPRLTVHPGPAVQPGNLPAQAARLAALPSFRLELLVNFLENDDLSEGAWSFACGGWMELERVEGGVENSL